MKIASVFGGAMDDTTTKEYKDTIKIGKLLTEHGYTIKTGGYRGIMEAASKGATENGGKAIGITCKALGGVRGNEYLSETIVTDTIYDRLELLLKESTVIIGQVGGVGTLAEIFLLLDVNRKEKRDITIYLMGDMWKEIFKPILPNLDEFSKSTIIFCDDYTDLKKYFTSLTDKIQFISAYRACKKYNLLYDKKRNIFIGQIIDTIWELNITEDDSFILKYRYYDWATYEGDVISKEDESLVEFLARILDKLLK